MFVQWHIRRIIKSNSINFLCWNVLINRRKFILYQNYWFYKQNFDYKTVCICANAQQFD